MEKNDPNIIHNLNNIESSSSIKGFFIILFTALILGVLTGFVFTKFNKLSTTSLTNNSKETVKKTVGIADKKTFKDNVEGILKEGGIEGEGNFHLERKGGASQNAYLTSSTVDLSEFIGKRVRVWGETFNGKKAGWLMDVGLVEVLE